MPSSSMSLGPLGSGSWIVLLVLLGCSGTDPTGDAAGGGSKATGGATSSAGGSGGTNASAGTSTAGGTSSAGTTSSGGSTTAGTSAGGSAGTSAGGGSAGGPPHVVGACDDLGAVDAFEDVTPPGIDLSGNGVTNVVVDPLNAGTLYAGTDKNGLQKSTNCGKDWTKVNSGARGDILDSGIIWSMVIDFADPDVLFAGSLYGSDNSLNKSTNGGVDWVSMAPEGSEIYNTVAYNFFQDLAIDPTDHAHLVLSFHADCSGPTGPECLAETTDSGANWRLFKGPLGGWQEGAGPLIIGGSKFILGTTQNGIYYTSDSGENWAKVGPGTDHQMYHATDGSYYTGSDYGINKSTDEGQSWTQIPSSPHGYGIIGDGKRLFNSLRNAGDKKPYFTSLETDGETWTPLASPDMEQGTVYFAYDSDHHVLYGANTASGLWRMVTQ